MIRVELYVALYLLIGCGFYLYHKKLVQETTEEGDAFTQGFVIFFFILGWFPVWVADIFAWFYYNIRAVKEYLSDQRKS